MKGDPSFRPSLDISAVIAGISWALVLLLVGAVAQGVYDHFAGLPLAARGTGAIVWQSLAAALAGFLSGRRASGAGWLHGCLAGVGLAVAGAVVIGVLTAFPEPAAFARAVAAGGAVGAAAGAVGVNLR